MSLLLALTIRSTVTLALVWLLDRVLGSRMNTRSRRLWWVIVPMSFLLPSGVPVFPAALDAPLAMTMQAGRAHVIEAAFGARVPSVAEPHFAGAMWLRVLAVVWLLGAIVYMAVVIVRTVRASRHWSRMRLNTDGELLSLLEDCKAGARITAPIGIAVSEAVPAPALHGWLRPRILLPAEMVRLMPREKLRAILLHELAHFRSLDIPLHWLHTLACAVHWFNPFVHIGTRAWMRFREEAADECAIAWMGGGTEAGDYGEAFVEALKHSGTFSLPLGALVVGESNQNLKYRMLMIINHAQKTPRALLAVILTIGIVVTAAFLPVRAAEPAASAAQADTAKSDPAIQAMLAWLKLADEGKYAGAWSDASKLFKAAMTQDKWDATMKVVRTPLGACTSRALLASKEMNKIPTPPGMKDIEGTFVVAQFQANYKNSGAMIETVTFEKEDDGVWRASGYFIK